MQCRVVTICLLAVVIVAGSGVLSAAQAGEKAPRLVLSREEQLHLLEAKQAKLALDQADQERSAAMADLDKVEKLFKDGLVTVTRLNDARMAFNRAKLKFRQAEIDLEKERLEFLKDATIISVVNARKYRSKDGEVMASVTIRNASDIGKARIAMAGEGRKVRDADLGALLKVDNVIVTLKGETRTSRVLGIDERQVAGAKAIVGDPFQLIVNTIEYGKEVTLEYKLLNKAVDSVTVSLEFLGTSREYDVYLKNESNQDLPDVASTQYSQIGKLGTKIRYDLNLKRLAKTTQSFAMIVLNLPPSIQKAFIDPESEASLTQVKFTDEITEQNLYFEASIPSNLSPKLVDQSLSFYIVVTRPSELKNIFELVKKHSNNIPAEDIQKIKGECVELVLIPKGVGKLDILMDTQYKEVEIGKPVDFKFRVMNSGTLVLRSIAPKLDLPIGWEAELDPKSVTILAGEEKATFTAKLIPPGDVSVGEYPVKIEAEGHSGVEDIEAIDKSFSVRLGSPTNITGTAILVGILVVMVLGIAIASIKVSRR